VYRAGEQKRPVFGDPHMEKEKHMSRPHAVRLLVTMDHVRRELIETVQDVAPEELGWAPVEGMKPIREILQEIGTMEKLTVHWLVTGAEIPWDMSAYVSSDSVQAAIDDLQTIRAETRAYLEAANEEKLETPIDVLPEWQQYFGKELEPEEAVRWVIMHEYYHLGQLISYRWAQGHNPYKGT
jgi:uncharacterized damage-inducible protein DinB